MCVSVPLMKYSSICLNISLCISGCVMEFRSLRFSGLEKIICPSFCLSISPLSNKISCPKCRKISLYAGLWGFTTEAQRKITQIKHTFIHTHSPYIYKTVLNTFSGNQICIDDRTSQLFELRRHCALP